MSAHWVGVWDLAREAISVGFGLVLKAAGVSARLPD